jgi:Protein of unknown function (DUF1236)
MRHNALMVISVAAVLALPGVAAAQGVPGGAAEGAAQGGAAGGLPGAIVGGVVGGVAGGVAGVLGIEQRPRFRTYVVEQRRPSYAYRDQVRVGVQLPAEGVHYYEVPAEYGVRGYRYTVVNDRPVLVDRSHRIVEVIE